MFIIHFSGDFDGPVYAAKTPGQQGNIYAGPRKLLQWLEGQLGLSGYPANTDYLRIELYRQALERHLSESHDKKPFYEHSYRADRFAAATALLGWRDELLLAGWDFSAVQDLPPRLGDLSTVEQLFQVKLQDPSLFAQASGFADRFVRVLDALPGRKLPVQEIRFYEPLALQEPVIQRLANILRSDGVPLSEKMPEATAAPGSRLGMLQRRLLNAAGLDDTALPQPENITEDDYSLLLLQVRRDSDAATVLAQMLAANPGVQPVFLIPEMNLMLERALTGEGFPAMGLLSASLARPSLQVLKLAPAFLWEPVDVFKIMEFATLPLKPLDTGLALEIARVLAEKPGLFSDTWFAAVYGYLERAEVPDEAREQYQFWFDRRRYPVAADAPKRDAIALYAYLQEWAQAHIDDTDASDASMRVLAEQARRIRELLEALPEQRITFLELERIVRTIYEPSPVQLTQAEVGRTAYVHNPGALADTAETLIWWNCIFENTAPLPDKWQLEERRFLEKISVLPGTPRQESKLAYLRQIVPVCRSSGRLILVLPEYADGTATVPSLLLGDIEAAFPDRRAFTFDLDNGQDRKRLSGIMSAPESTDLQVRLVGRHKPQLQFAQPALLSESEYETPTNLERLFYYPHRWFFKQQLKLYSTSLLHVTADNTLSGNLAHRFFEKLLKEDLSSLDRGAIHEWVESQARDLLPREGATLLLYGREPERNAFLNRVKNAAWSLVSLLRTNGWSVAHTELDLEGAFSGVPVRGKADLVLQRGEEWAIVDLKWSGTQRRKEMIRNGEDLQLILYASLLPPPDHWPHTAYFILEEGKMVARNASAFREAIVAGGGDDDHQAVCAAIYQKMLKTFEWRMAQLQKGVLELRSARTAPELEALYEEALFDLLEMKNDDARWDEYRTLLAGG